MKLERYVFRLFLLLTVLSCSKDKEVVVEKPQLPNPQSAFSVKQVAPNDPFTFEFTNQSKDYTEARWSFGDDSTSSKISPQHTFLKTGTFIVKLRVLNENEDWAQRETVVNIDAEKLVTFKAAKNGTARLLLSYDTDIAVKKAMWYRLLSDGKLETVSETATADVAISTGNLEVYMLEIETPKGSKIAIAKLLSELGIVKDWTNVDNTFLISQDNSSGPDAGEGSKKLIDNKIETKLFIGGYQSGMYWQFVFYQPQLINAYRITTGNDAPERDPKSWEIQGSDDGEHWTVLDAINDYSFGTAPTDRKKSETFVFPNSKKYGYYRYVLKSVSSGSNFQMSEFRLLELPR